METPVVLDEREREERERVDSSPRFPRRHKILFGLVVTIGVIVFILFNVWVYRSATSGNALSPATLWQAVSTSGTGFQAVTRPGPVTPSPAPTSRPTGPGQYACDEYGICNIYEDSKRAGCPQTYADPHCLDKCGDQRVRCPKPK